MLLQINLVYFDLAFLSVMIEKHGPPQHPGRAPT